MTETATASRSAGPILALFWGSILVSLALPWALYALFEVSAHRRTVAEAVKYLSLHFFAPGYHYFLVGVLSAAPFVVCALFLLFHLGWPRRMPPAQYSRRMAGVLGGLILMFGVNFWTHLSALMYPDAQGVFAYFFLPYIQLVLLPMGYGMGRLILAFLHIVRGSEDEAA
jgi:hypothetical protein